MNHPEEETFEARLQGVQDIIAQIEQGRLPLEVAVRQYENGMKTLKTLEAELTDMNRRLTVMQEGPDGTEQVVPLEMDI